MGTRQPSSDERRQVVAARSWLRGPLPWVWCGFGLCLLAIFILVYQESRGSWLQSRVLSEYAATLDYQVQTGAAESPITPGHGPHDQRLGYAELPFFSERLQQRHYRISRQAQPSQALVDYQELGLYPPYDEKQQAGLTVLDAHGQVFYRSRYPQRQYASFEELPPVLVSILSFIEDRHLLSPPVPSANPAVDWPRFVKAALSQAGRSIDLDVQGAGGSTLATQLEKFRHSPDGRTPSALEKVRQMASASVRAYRHGPDTLAYRRQLALSYLNGVPLAAAPGHGEVHGLADGLWVWFAADAQQVNRQLLEPSATQEQRGMALRQVVALMIAQRRPTHYLNPQGREDLARLVDSYLRLLHANHIITDDWRDAALAQPLVFRDFSQQPSVNPIQADKATLVTRSRLSHLLGRSFYDLDRTDLQVDVSFEHALQQAVQDYLQRLADPEQAKALGLLGERMLSPNKTADVRYSFTLFERTDDAFQVRVQTDNTGQPFDINDSSKLELGSTAKLRVLATYLEIIAELHQRHAGKSVSELRAIPIEPLDMLSRWSIDTLVGNPGIDLRHMLEQALERRYSASPHEAFFTGGGLHRFGNFRSADNSRLPTLRESLRESINLPFIRLMRDIVRYSLYQHQERTQLLKDDADPRRQDYLSRFADQEGRVFLGRFWRKYQGRNADERLEIFLDGLRPTASRLAAVHRYLFPHASPDTFEDFMAQSLPGQALPAKRLQSLYQSYGPGAYDLPDQGYIARVHPLELWLLGYLQQHPRADFEQVILASRLQRQEVYGWLFKTRHRSARDTRIRTMLEVEAFLDIHQRWQRLGYPFAHLVPSLATAIGSSGDRPAALAELIGIILNDGVRQPVRRINRLHFAAGTPYETEFEPDAPMAEQVMPQAVAQALRLALADVVDSGTARRLAGGVERSDGGRLLLGGKTGTGDNRFMRIGRHGNIISSQARSRTATFVFYLGDRHFGTLTAYVEGSEAERFNFTSALPVQALKGMLPLLQEHLQQ